MEVTLDAPASTYIDVMTDCESLAVEFLDFPEGKSKYPGGVRDILAFPPWLENKSLDVLLPFTVAKKKFLSDMLARLKGPIAGQARAMAATAAAVAAAQFAAAAVCSVSQGCFKYILEIV